MSLSPRPAKWGKAQPCVHPSGSDQDPCRSYQPGHRLHTIQAKKVGESPWGWRDATVISVDGAGVLQFALLDSDDPVVAWHHERLTDEVRPGDPVRLHPRYYTLDTTHGWLSMLLIRHPRPPDEPPYPELWKPETTCGMVNLSTGRGLASG